VALAKHVLPKFLMPVGRVEEEEEGSALTAGSREGADVDDADNEEEEDLLLLR
jgi:hypothetical protein